MKTPSEPPPDFSAAAARLRAHGTPEHVLEHADSITIGTTRYWRDGAVERLDFLGPLRALLLTAPTFADHSTKEEEDE